MVVPVCAAAILLAGHLTARTTNRSQAWQAAIVASEARLSMSHLWLEEVLAGDRTVDPRRDVFGNLDFVTRACRALAAGGDPGGGVGRVEPVDDERVRRAVAPGCGQVAALRARTAERLATPDAHRSGTRADRRYDASFMAMQASFARAARASARLTARNGDRLARINVGAVGFLLALSVVAATMLHRRDRQREELLGRQEQMLATMHDAFITIDSRGDVTGWNPAAAGVFGWRREEVVGRSLASTIIPERFREAHTQGLVRYLATGEARVAGQRLQLSALHRNGTEFPVEMTITAIDHPHGPPTFAAFLRDVTERRRLDSYRETRLALASALATAPSVPDATVGALAAIARTGWDFGGLWLLDEGTGRLRCAATWHGSEAGLEAFATASRSLQFAAGEGLPGKVLGAREPAWILGIDADEPSFPRAGDAARAGLRTGVGIPLMSEGRVLGALEFFSLERREAPEQGLLETLTDLSELLAVFLERRRSDERLREHAADLSRLEVMARTDDLTGLLNRRGWNEELEREFGRAHRAWQPLTVALIDLDHFKRFNDTFGHPAGDRLLKEASAAWRDSLRAGDILARYGGEEFAIALPTDLERAIPLLDRLRAVVPGGETCSVGAAEWDRVEPAESLLARADQALYAAKQRGRDRVEVASDGPPPER